MTMRRVKRDNADTLLLVQDAADDFVAALDRLDLPLSRQSARASWEAM